MKKFNFLIILFLFLFITSCGEEKVEVKEINKQDFYITTENILDLRTAFILEKTWKLESSQDITLSSNANWRVSSIEVAQWDSVTAWQVLAKLEDNIWSYNLNLSVAWNNLEKVRIEYEKTEISLNKNIFDLEKNLELLKQNLKALESKKEQALLQNQDTLINSSLNTENSQSSLQLEQLEKNIEKLEYDYELLLESNKQTIEWYYLTIQKEQNSLLVLISDIIEFSDKILWVTSKNKNANNIIENFLWAKDTTQKLASKDLLSDLINYTNNDLEQFSSKIIDSEDEILNYMGSLIDWYNKTKIFLNSLEKTMNNSVSSQWTLSSSDIASYISSINWYQTTLQANYSVYISSYNWIKTFLNTYQASQESSFKSIDLQKQERDILKSKLNSWELWAEVSLSTSTITYDDQIISLQSNIEIAENNLENAKKTKEINLRSINNNISSAKIAYNDALKQVNKLIISSPISWIIEEVLIDLWQEVWQNTALFSIVNEKIPEVKVYFDRDEINLINMFDIAYWVQNNKTYTWTISSISTIADNNLNYPVTIKFWNDFNLIWELVDINIPISSNKLLLPINFVEILDYDNIWKVYVLENNELNEVKLNLWEVYWDKIEIKWCVDLGEEECESLNIILSDVSNYDKTKFNLVEK